VLLAARLYHRGKTKRLVAAGALTTPTGFHQKGAGRAMAEIWQDLGVPASAISAIGGRNTFEEIRSLKAILEEEDGRRNASGLLWCASPSGPCLQNGPDSTGSARVGLLTSAWHMSRALRLARREGLELIPVPADFATDRQRPSWNTMLLGSLPSGYGFHSTHRALKERLAGLLGR
jgi:uncharacterized SAM-binding protein YcdF (DUF218 family)